MENLLFAVVILLCIILVVLLAVVVFFLFRFLKIKEKALLSKNEAGNNNITLKHKGSNFIPSVVHTEMVEAKKYIQQNPSASGSFCIDHPELPAKGICSISDEAYCDLCITKEKDIRMARKYLNLFLDNDWLELFMINNNSTGADKLNETMRLKRELWRDSQIPVITQKQFKINIESDEIETYTVIMGRENDQDTIQEKLSFLN